MHRTWCAFSWQWFFTYSLLSVWKLHFMSIILVVGATVEKYTFINYRIFNSKRAHAHTFRIHREMRMVNFSSRYAHDSVGFSYGNVWYVLMADFILYVIWSYDTSFLKGEISFGHFPFIALEAGRECSHLFQAHEPCGTYTATSYVYSWITLHRSRW